MLFGIIQRNKKTVRQKHHINYRIDLDFSTTFYCTVPESMGSGLTDVQVWILALPYIKYITQENHVNIL